MKNFALKIFLLLIFATTLAVADVFRMETASIGPFGTGSTITQLVIYAPNLTPVATAAAIGTSQQTFTVTGLSTSDKLIINGPVPTALCPNTDARVSAANTLQLDFTTLTAVACTPAAGIYNIVAIRS